MRSQVELEYRDLTNYIDSAGQDVIAVAIDHYWGITETSQVLTLGEFVREYPTFVQSPSYVESYSALDVGAPFVETVRVLGKNTYFVCDYEETTAVSARRKTIPGAASTLFTLGLKYPGTTPLEFRRTYEALSFEVSRELAEIEFDDGFRSFILLKVTLQGKNGTEFTQLESFEGSLRSTDRLDGKTYSIESIIRSGSDYLVLNVKPNAEDDLKALAEPLGQVTDYPDKLTSSVPFTRIPIEIDEFQDAYQKYFSSSEQSSSTIIIPPGASLDMNKFVETLVEAREDCVAITGYPTDLDYTVEDVKTFFATLPKSRFSFFHALRQVVTLSNTSVLSSGVGAVAGRYAAVANLESINQPPSAKEFGGFPGVLDETFTEDETLALSKLGINSVYQTITGPRMWGVRSMHPRSESYYAKTNVIRVLTNITRPAISAALNALHTGNTVRKRANIQNGLQSILNNLISVEALRLNSLAICNDTNNRDVDTKGGEILIIDLELWFVKVIEKVRIRITATDSSVSVTTLAA